LPLDINYKKWYYKYISKGDKMSEDFGWGGDEFLIGDCMDDWGVEEGGWDDFEARECFLDNELGDKEEYDEYLGGYE
jgi:hypothetical protein